jgi:hypothetical protein
MGVLLACALAFVLGPDYAPLWPILRSAGERAMLRRRKEHKRKSIALTLMHDVQGSATPKLTMFEKVGAAAGFAMRTRRTWQSRMLREFAAMEKRDA